MTVWRQPGPLEDYHARDHVTHSKLQTWRAGGPRLYHLRHVARLLDHEPSPEMVFGQYVEDLVQEREPLAVVMPDGIDGRTKEGRAWKHANAGRPTITAERAEAAQAITSNVHANPAVMAAITAARVQPEAQSVFDSGVGYGVPIQCRPDWSGDGCSVTDFQPYTLDMKTTKDFAGFEREARRYNYDMQAAFIDVVFGLAFHRHLLLVCEKAAPYRVQLVDITAPAREVRTRITGELMVLHSCLAANQWPLCPDLVTWEELR